MQEACAVFAIVTWWRFSGESETTMMIQMYFHTSDPAKNKMARWFQQHQISLQSRNILRQPLTRPEIKHLFLMTANGSDDLLAKRSKATQALALDLEKLSFNQLVALIQKHPQILKNPIVFDDRSLLTGFNSEKVGVFIPQKQRKKERRSLFDQLYSAELI